jgi:hypothetical protein
MTDDQWERIASLAKKFYELGRRDTELFTLYDQMYEGSFNKEIRVVVVEKLEKLQSFELLEYLDDLNEMTAEEIASTLGYIKALQDRNPTNN